MLVLFHALISPLEAFKHIHEHKCVSCQRDVNVINIKKQKMTSMEKSKHHEMMQSARTHHKNGTQK